ncbi:MAG TPA: AAA family ATPase [Nitrososphaerales archaeon]|nr:AAA family ATPase [Nitrososphaerales archaeon]
MLIVAITGMPGAGKSTAAQALVDGGWRRFVMGDAVREETKRRGLQPDAKNTGDVMRDLREKRGEAAIAELCLRAIGDSGAERVVVDGIRSLAEVDAFRKKAKVLLVAIHASPARRYSFLKERGRSDDPLSYEMFRKRDERELKVGIGEAIAMADESLSNERLNTKELEGSMVKLVGGWLGSDGPHS